MSNNIKGQLGTIVDDPIVRAVLGITLIVLLVILLSPALIGWMVMLSSHLLTRPESSWASDLTLDLARVKALPQETSGQLIGAIPILLTVLCFKGGRTTRLNWVGRTVFILVLLGTLISAVAVGYFDPANARQRDAILSGQEGLSALHDGGSVALRLMLHYLFLILGLSIAGRHE